MAHLQFISLIGIKPIPAGSFAVVTGDIADPATMYDSEGKIKRSLWKSIRVFKRRANAERYKAKLSQQGWNEFMRVNNLINLN